MTTTVAPPAATVAPKVGKTRSVGVNKPPNKIAMIIGSVVIVGVDKDTAEPAALSPAQAGAILKKIRAPSA